MTALACLSGIALMIGTVIAADAKDASVRYVARSRWGAAAYLLGLVLMLAAFWVSA